MESDLKNKMKFTIQNLLIRTVKNKKGKRENVKCSEVLQLPLQLTDYFVPQNVYGNEGVARELVEQKRVRR